MQNTAHIRTAPNGDVLRADLGSPVPADWDDPFSADWEILGLADENGVEMTYAKNVGTIPVWQKSSPGKYYVEATSFETTFNLAQVSANVFRLYWGVDWVLTAGGTAKLTIPANPGLDEMMLAVRWIGDNNSTHLVIVERGMVTNRQAVRLSRTSGVFSGLTFGSVDENNTLVTYLTNDSNIVDVLSAS